MRNLIDYVTKRHCCFVVIKPEFLEMEDLIIRTLIKRGIRPFKKQTRILTKEQAAELYKPHENEPFYNDLVNYMSSGRSIGMLCTGSQKRMDDAKEVIRKRHGQDEMKNVIHSSDSYENVNRESKIYFE